MSVIVRASAPADHKVIQQLHLDAFDASENETVARLALELLSDPTAAPMLSLLALENQVTIGHVIFSRVRLQPATESKRVYIMAPLAVAPSHQRQGIGGLLIKKGLQLLKEQGVDIVLVLGDPKYYERAGFTASHNIQPPYDLAYPDAWMALELTQGALASTQGVAQCATCLSAPEYW